MLALTPKKERILSTLAAHGGRFDNERGFAATDLADAGGFDSVRAMTQMIGEINKEQPDTILRETQGRRTYSIVLNQKVLEKSLTPAEKKRIFGASGVATSYAGRAIQAEDALLAAQIADGAFEQGMEHLAKLHLEALTEIDRLTARVEELELELEAANRYAALISPEMREMADKLTEAPKARHRKA